MTVTDRPNYFVVDVETDSLNARTGHLLEIAGVVVNSELEVISKAPFHSVIRYTKPEAKALREGADPFVRDMHDKTGLWDRLTSGEASSLKSVDLAIYEWLAYFGKPRTMPVMGNSVRLDMNFMDEHLPRTAGFLDYHMRDVSTVAGLAADWYGVPWFEKAGTHSALADVLECIEELKHYRKHAFRTKGEHYVFARGAEWNAQLLATRAALTDIRAIIAKPSTSADLAHDLSAQLGEVHDLLAFAERTGLIESEEKPDGKD